MITYHLEDPDAVDPSVHVCVKLMAVDEAALDRLSREMAARGYVKIGRGYDDANDMLTARYQRQGVIVSQAEAAGITPPKTVRVCDAVSRTVNRDRGDGQVGWESRDIVLRIGGHRDAIPDALEHTDPELGPVPAGVLMTVAWCGGLEGTETLWFEDWAAANTFARARDPGWTDGKGDFSKPGQRYGSPASARLYRPPSRGSKHQRQEVAK